MSSITQAQSSLVSPPSSTTGSEASRSGIWVGVFAITMSFAALSSALYVRQGSGDWSHITVPSVIYLNTLALLLSSGTMELARRIKARDAALTPNAVGVSLAWLAATLRLAPACLPGTLSRHEPQQLFSLRVYRLARSACPCRNCRSRFHHRATRRQPSDVPAPLAR